MRRVSCYNKGKATNNRHQKGWFHAICSKSASTLASNGKRRRTTTGNNWADRFGKYRFWCGPGSPRVGFDQQVCGRLPRQALLRGLWIHRPSWTTSNWLREGIVWGRVRKRATPLWFASQYGRLSSFTSAGGCYPRDGDGCWGTLNPWRKSELLRAKLSSLWLCLESGNWGIRLRCYSATSLRSATKADYRWGFGLQ